MSAFYTLLKPQKPAAEQVILRRKDRGVQEQHLRPISALNNDVTIHRRSP